MALMYVVIGSVVVWAIYRAIVKARSSSVQEIPLKVTVRYEKSGTETRRDSEEDEWEGSFWEVEQPHPTNARLHLRYVDGAGQQTERTVDVRQFGAFGPSCLLIGHCNLRNATRSFRTDRIQSCVDVETGEVVSDVRSYLQV